MNSDKEIYGFFWKGKNKALKEANKKPAGKLYPCRKESVDWDNTENLYFEGDNLEVLKLLAKERKGTIDLIYIDPPYNTGRALIYEDDYKMKQQDKEDADSGPLSDGEYRPYENQKYGYLHADWCSMIYPRLLVARELMAENGAIFISIDDNELFNLKKICDEVFGETNFVTMFTWIKTMNPPSLGAKVRDNMEYVLCYEKNYQQSNKLYGMESFQKDSPLANASNRNNTVIIPAGSCDFADMDEGRIMEGIKPSKAELLDPVEVSGGRNKGPFRVRFRSKWSQDYLDKEISEGTRFLVKKSGYFSVRYIKGNIDHVVPDKFLYYKKFDVRDNEYGRKELEELTGKVGFDYPKNTPLIETLIRMYLGNEKEGVVMDFFSGTATTAHAVMKMNAEDGGKRRFIMVQKPEKCAEGSPAKAAGFNTISDIGKTRIKKAGEKIIKETGAVIDHGFKVYKLTGE